MFKHLFSQGLLIACTVAFSALVHADALLKKEQDYSLVPKLRFQFDLDKSRQEKYQLFDDVAFDSLQSSPYEPLLYKTQIDQIDAAFYYPLGTQGMSFDLGLNMKYIDGKTRHLNDGQQQSRNFSAAIPMVYATALFDLPFEGLSAGFEGKHHLGLERDALSGFDYKAKLKYEWSDGFGLQGGWQHQQYLLDKDRQTATDYENKGPFLDFYLKF